MILAQSFITKEVGHLAPEPFWFLFSFSRLASAPRLLSHLCASRLCASRLRLAFLRLTSSRGGLSAPLALRLSPLRRSPLRLSPLRLAIRASSFFPRGHLFFFCGNISLHLLWDRIRGPIHTRNPPSEDHALDLDQPSIEVYSGPCES